ncbi:MAG: hypothetical protein J6A79_09720, partial [Clostridia bacterium]|nr:hypothetical protein [Clostridia bacterium]
METIKKSIRKKELLSLLVILLLFFLLRSALTYAGSRFSQTREDELMGLKANTLTDILSDADNLRTAADRRFS